MSGEPDDRDLRAAEYVLGTLSASERAAMELERTVDPNTDAAVRGWERRLAPLAGIVPPAAPGSRVWAAIEAALRGRAVAPAPAPANDNRVAELARAVRRWRWTAAGAGALAAGLALFIFLGEVAGLRPGAPQSRYLAVVNRGGEAPALLISIDVAAGTAQVRPVGAEAPAGKSLELWYVGAGQAPKSLGVIGTEAKRLPLPAASDPAGLSEGLFAVSVEPPGGSPTGAATGPVVYTGKLIRE
jgi:anti-sigma-K factor RskA